MEETKIKTWMNRKLNERGIGTSTLSLLTGNKITNASMFRWYGGIFKPSPKKLELVCETLSKIPVISGSSEFFEDAKDLITEARQQFTRHPRWKD